MKIEKFFEVNPLLALQESFLTLSHLLSQQCQVNGINQLQGLVLIALLFDQDRFICPKDLVRVFKSSKSNMSQAISTLEYKNLIKRHLSEKDARSYYLTLSHEGKVIANQLISFLDMLQTKIEQSINENELKKMIHHLHLIQLELNKKKVIS